jgi:hypothetical protein
MLLARFEANEVASQFDSIPKKGPVRPEKSWKYPERTVWIRCEDG